MVSGEPCLVETLSDSKGSLAVPLEGALVTHAIASYWGERTPWRERCQGCDGQGTRGFLGIQGTPSSQRKACAIGPNEPGRGEGDDFEDQASSHDKHGRTIRRGFL